MATKRYADIPAARHLRDPAREPAADTLGDRQDDAASRPLPTGLMFRPGEEKTYRKQRTVALLLTSLVGLSVPALITLLVLFG